MASHDRLRHEGETVHKRGGMRCSMMVKGIEYPSSNFGWGCLCSSYINALGKGSVAGYLKMSRHLHATIIGGEECAGMRLWAKPISDSYFTCPISSNKKIITSKVNLDRCQYKVCRYLSTYPHERNVEFTVKDQGYVD